MFVVLVVPLTLIRALGKPVVSAFQAVPVLFLIFCLGGLSLGMFLAGWVPRDPEASGAQTLLGVGVCAFSYSSFRCGFGS
jgi:hypothetical protein